MTNRPVDWQPLADTDPVPGDPARIADLERRLRDTADTIARQASTLRGLCTDEYWDSDGGKQFRKAATDLAGKLDQVQGRYDATAGALRTYGPALDDAQTQSLTARRQAQDAEDTHQRQIAAAAQTAAAAGPPTAIGPASVAVGPTAVVAANPNDDSYLDTARATLTEAVRNRDDAARAAAHTIGQALHDGLNDGWRDKAKNLIHEHAAILNKIAGVAGWIATACGTASLIIGCIPVVGTAIAGVLDTAATLASAVSLICNLTLALAGDGSWLSVGLDAVGLLTFGIGRASLGASVRSAEASRGAVQQATMSSLREDAQVAGRNLTGRALNDAYNLAKRNARGLNARAARRVIARAPAGGFPRVGDFFRDGLHPGPILHERVEEITEARALAGRFRAGTLTAAEREFGRPWDLPEEVVTSRSGAQASLDALHSMGATSEAAERFARNATVSTRAFRSSTGIGVTADLLDKAGAFAVLQQPLTGSAL